MRKAINENPQVQLGVIAVMAVAFAFIMFTMVLKKDPPPPTDSTTATTATTPATGAAVGADPAATGATDPAAPSTPASPDVAVPPAAPPATPADSSDLEAGTGLPAKFVDAYDSGKAVALLILDRRGISDRAVRRYRGKLESVDGVTLFNVPPKNISRYAEITQGVAVSRTPALVVVKPENLSGGQPVGTVTYGFRSVRSAKQALRDALYKGSSVNYYPQ